MKPGERQLSDFYYDDPVEEASGTRRNFKGIISLILLIAVGGTYLQTTLAANINLNSGLVVEFGQGVAATTACSGGTNLIVTPISSFQNVSGAGAFYFSSVKVSNIPSGCNGKDFIINAYNSSGGSPLAIFNSTSTSAVVYNNAGTFQLGARTTVGASITSGSGTFTLTFTTPVAAAASVFKLTIQSSNHEQISGGAYSIGDIGPGGGKIFYYSAAGFNCGPTYSATGSPTGGKCNYLEVAPGNWSGGVDPLKPWALPSYFAADISGIDNINFDDNPFEFRSLANLKIGNGYKNSLAIITQGNNATTAAGAARAYGGGTKSDWYLPSDVELNLLCHWGRDAIFSAADQQDAGGTLDGRRSCDNAVGAINSGTGAGAGFQSSEYWSSNENSDGSGAFHISFDPTDFLGASKEDEKYVRPIRAF
jgi:hypothetical protein